MYLSRSAIYIVIPVIFCTDNSPSGNNLVMLFFWSLFIKSRLYLIFVKPVYYRLCTNFLVHVLKNYVWVRNVYKNAFLHVDLFSKKLFLYLVFLKLNNREMQLIVAIDSQCSQYNHVLYVLSNRKIYDDVNQEFWQPVSFSSHPLPSIHDVPHLTHLSLDILMLLRALIKFSRWQLWYTVEKSHDFLSERARSSWGVVISVSRRMRTFASPSWFPLRLGR